MQDLTSPTRDGTDQTKKKKHQKYGLQAIGIQQSLNWRYTIWGWGNHRNKEAVKSNTDLPSRETVTMGERSRTIF